MYGRRPRLAMGLAVSAVLYSCSQPRKYEGGSGGNIGLGGNLVSGTGGQGGIPTTTSSGGVTGGTGLGAGGMGDQPAPGGASGGLGSVMTGIGGSINNGGTMGPGGSSPGSGGQTAVGPGSQGGAANGGMTGVGGGGTSGLCNPDQTRCSGDGLQTCKSNGQWSSPATCGAHRACTGTTGAASCTCAADPVCVSTNPTCAGPTALVNCAADADGCFYQTTSIPCTNGGCSGGACCTNACQEGAMECADSGVLACEKGLNGCTSWKVLSTCISPLVCERSLGPGCGDFNWAEWPMPTENPNHNPPKYIADGNGTVTDAVTHLVWQQAGSLTAAGTQSSAAAYCVAQTTGGYRDWRLPSQVELISIFDYTLLSDISLSALFTGVAGASYWSASSSAGNPWGFDSTGASLFGPASAYVRCVR